MTSNAPGASDYLPSPIHVQSYHDHDYKAASGHDILHDQPRKQPFEDPRPGPPDGTPIFNGYMTVVRNKSELTKDHSVNLSFEQALLVEDPENSVAAEMLNTFKSSETSVRIVAYAHCFVENECLIHGEGKIDFNKTAKDYIQDGNWNQFHKDFGAYYISKVHKGGELFISINIQYHTSDAAESLMGKLKGSKGEIVTTTFLAELKRKMAEVDEHASIRVEKFLVAAVPDMPSFDSSDLEDAVKKITTYLNKFEQDVKKSPCPIGAEATVYSDVNPDLMIVEKMVADAAEKVTALADRAAEYEDILDSVVSIRALVQSKTCTITEAGENKLKALEADVPDAITALREHYALMKDLDSYKTPGDIDDKRLLPPAHFRQLVTEVRATLKEQIIAGATYRVAFPLSGKYFDEPSASRPKGMSKELWEEMTEPDGSKKYPYVSVSTSGTTPYQISRKSNDGEGEALNVGDIVRIRYPKNGADEAYESYEIYYSSKAWAVGLAEYVPDNEKYHWKIEVEGKSDGDALLASDDIQLRSEYRTSFRLTFQKTWAAVSKRKASKKDYNMRFTRAY